MGMFQIKICGITSVEDALTVARAGADAIGLNFYPRSPRYISLDAARQIVAALPGEIVRVGLFVNASSSEVCRFYDELPLDLIQLHGDETPEFLGELGGRPVIRAFRIEAGKLRSVVEYLDRCRQIETMPQYVMIDSLVVGVYGGTGKIADWTAAKEYAAQAGLPPLVLAGGLLPENVGEAIQTVRPAAVDVASGVELQPGHKDPVKVQAFVRIARAAYSQQRRL
jgi:phosphoribosylanthranilate isomerase